MRYLIKGGTIINGLGGEPFTGDILIQDGRIEKVSFRVAAEDTAVINAEGRVVCPGFIDIHRHADARVLDDDFGILELRQGITSVISGNCGISLAPMPKDKLDLAVSFARPILGSAARQFETFSEYYSALRGQRLRVNFAGYIGNGSVRIAVNGFEHGPLDKQKMERAKWYIRDAMDAGAAGLSLGPFYSPENFYSTDELAELCAVVGSYKNDAVAVHLRREGSGLEAAVAEALYVAKKAGTALHISHFKAAAKEIWHSGIHKAMQSIQKAIDEGMDVSVDVYPYEAGASSLISLMPPKALEGGIPAALERMKNRTWRDKIRDELAGEDENWDNLVLSAGWGNIVVSGLQSAKNAVYIGKSISDIAKITGTSEVDCVLDLLIEERGDVGMLDFVMSPEDVDAVVAWKHSFIISDSVYVQQGKPHPRVYGAFPKIICDFVLKRKILDLQTAIKKMTFLPAKRARLSGKGAIMDGYDADILVFDLNSFRDNATYITPDRYASGLDYVFVNGKLALKDDRVQDSFGGRLCLPS